MANESPELGQGAESAEEPTDYLKLYMEAHPDAVQSEEKAHYVGYTEKLHVEGGMELDAMIGRNQAQLDAMVAASDARRGPAGRWEDNRLQVLEKKIEVLREARNATCKAGETAGSDVARDYDRYQEAKQRLERFDSKA